MSYDEVAHMGQIGSFMSHLVLILLDSLQKAMLGASAHDLSDVSLQTYVQWAGLVLSTLV